MSRQGSKQELVLGCGGASDAHFPWVTLNKTHRCVVAVRLPGATQKEVHWEAGKPISAQVGSLPRAMVQEESFPNVPFLGYSGAGLRDLS